MGRRLGALALVVATCLLVAGGCQPAAQSKPAASQPAAQAPPAAAPTSPPPTAEARPAERPAPEPEIVQLGTFYSLGAAPLFVGVERGFFAEQGLQVEIKRTASASEVMGFLGAGHLDVAAGGVSAPLYNAIARAVPIKVVAPLGLASESPDQGFTFLMARKDLYDSGAARGVAQLRGRKIAITGLGSTNHWHLARLLQSADLRLDEVDVVDMSYPDMVTALGTGSLDAAILASPFDVQATRTGVAEMLVSNVAPGQMLTVLMYGPQFMDERRSAAQRFMLGYANAIRATQRDGDIFRDNLAVYEKYTGLKPEDLLASRPPVFDPSLRIDGRPMLDYQQFLLGERAVTYANPLSEQQLIDRSFAERALRQAGNP